MCKVSVIIPVYNTEKYLKECLDSIVNQSLEDIEIICIDDGSTDNSLEILREYAENDSRFKIFSQENNGQGSARNYGLDVAKGEYIYFMDSDDFIELNTLSDCYNEANKNNLDFLMFQLINYDESKKSLYQDNDYDMPNVGDLVADNVFSYADLNHLIFQVAVSPVNKLYSKKFLDDINVRFPEDVIFEDNVFFWNVFLNAKRIKFLKHHYYIRRRHSSSTTGNAGIRFVDTLEIHKRIFIIFKKFNIFDEFKKYLFNKKVVLANVRFNQVNDEVKSVFFNEMKNDFKEMSNEYGYDNIIEYLDYPNKLIFETVMESDGFEEFLLIIENSYLKSRINKLESKNNNLKKEINFLRKENDLILNSTSWRITKPLRNFKKI